MNVKLFTHTDLDGIGCAVVAKTAFDNIDIEYCNYTEINEKILDFLHNEKPTDYDRIFITDISVNEEVAETLDMIYRGGVSKVQLVDHHGTALWLAEKYPMWCHVRTEETNLYKGLDTREKVLASGTSLFFKFLRDKHLPRVEFNSKLKAFVETVRRYDCWEWHNIYKDDQPKRLNDLYYLIGRDDFLERFTSSPLPVFTETELKLLEVEQHRINKYIWYKKQEVKEIKWQIGGKTYTVAYVFAEQHSSLLGNAIAEDLGDTIDFVLIVDVGNSKVSLRGIHDYIDLGRDVAKYMGGGGHPKASGFEFNDTLRSVLLLNILGVDITNE